MFCKRNLVVFASLKLVAVMGIWDVNANENVHSCMDFNANEYKSPASSFGPMARWWWPGNDVTNDELIREINVFAENDFAGVEVQTLRLGLPDLDEKSMQRVLSWDTPSYYEHLKTVMEEAKRVGLIVDMTNGSGWPPGGPFLSVEDGMLDLGYSVADIKGGLGVSIELPQIDSNTEIRPKIEAVLAVKEATSKSDVSSKATYLDPSTVTVVTDCVNSGKLNWDAPDGEWKVFTFWSQPASETGSMVAAATQGPVLNHLDKEKVFKNYDYLFGDRTGLTQFYGNPLRAIFTDSYEFSIGRHYSDDFLSYFKDHRGYDASPWLPANMIKGYNYAIWKNPGSSAKYAFGDQDWRIVYDYDLTVSELFQENFADASRGWTEDRGMMFRNQGYGMNLDVIAIAGHASIPETESMTNSIASIKLVTSGAHLYNRPVVSAESLVFRDRAYMTTPQKARIGVDKLFAAGVNQIIYHGIPYRYVTENTMPEGWYPFCAPGINFSSEFGESNVFWKHQKKLNQYIQRTQYAMRLGKSQSDVLIYFPYVQDVYMEASSSEILDGGYLPKFEPPLPRKRQSRGEKHSLKMYGKWVEKVYEVIDELDRNGITWDWVNDASLQVASLNADKNIVIRDNSYQALILPDVPWIQLKSVECIGSMANNGMKLLVYGDAPTKQPSFYQWEKNDEVVRNVMEQVSKYKSSSFVNAPAGLHNWILGLNSPVQVQNSCEFIRRQNRELSDGSRIQFFWNREDKWTELKLTLDEDYESIYWLDASSGEIFESSNKLNPTYRLAPFESIILYAKKHGNTDEGLVSDRIPLGFANGKKVLQIDRWNVSSGDTRVKDTCLFDWKENDRFKHLSTDGIYTATFNIDKVDPERRYILDLGDVCYSAEVLINGQSVGQKIFSPYLFDLSEMIRSGANHIEIHVTPGGYNAYVGEAENGNDRYKAFEKNSGLMSAGLLGPVIVYESSKED